MMNFLRMMGMHELPTGTLAVCTGLGVALALGIRFLLFRDSAPGLHIDLGLVLVGALIGGLLGMCYFVVVEHCGKTLCG